MHTAAENRTGETDGHHIHPRIDADTIRSQWGGERLDLRIVIEGLR